MTVQDKFSDVSVKLSKAQLSFLRDEVMWGSTASESPALFSQLEEGQVVSGTEALYDLYWELTSIIDRAQHGDKDKEARRELGFGQRMMVKLETAMWSEGYKYWEIKGVLSQAIKDLEAQGVVTQADQALQERLASLEAQQEEVNNVDQMIEVMDEVIQEGPSDELIQEAVEEMDVDPGPWRSHHVALPSLYKLSLLEALPWLSREGAGGFALEDAVEVICQSNIGQQVSHKQVQTYLSELCLVGMIRAMGTRSSWQDGELVHEDLYCLVGWEVKAVPSSREIPEYADYGELQDQDRGDELMAQEALLEEYAETVSQQYRIRAERAQGQWSSTAYLSIQHEISYKLHQLREELGLNHGDILYMLQDRELLDEWGQESMDDLQDSLRL